MRYVGLTFLVFASLLVGRTYARSLLHRPELTAELAELFDQLAVRVRCYLQPYKRAFSEITPRTERSGELLQLLSRDIPMQKSYAEWSGRGELDRETDERLLSLFSKLGGADVSHELSMLTSVRDELSESSAAALDEARKRGKSAVIISVAAGLGLALLLL